MKCDKFETPLNKFCLQAIPQYTVYSWKSETETRPWLIIWKIFLFKSFFIFLVFSLSLHKCRKSLPKTTLMSLNWKVMDQTMPTIIHLSRCTFGAVSTRILQEIYSWRTDEVFFFNDKFLQKRRLALCWEIFPYQLKEERFKSFFWYHLLLSTSL